MTSLRLATVSLSFGALLLGACSSTDTPRVAMPAAASASAPRMDDRLTQAAATPLTDLNVVRAQIPTVLSVAAKNPYALPADSACPALVTLVEELDGVLGADLDTTATSANPSLLDRGTNAAGDAVVGAVRSSAESVVPFRGWVRKLSGAERYSRDVAAAIAAGTVRRAYLKGLGQAGSCPAPAAPRNPSIAKSQSGVGGLIERVVP